jgi:hypothetical protein
MWVCASTQKPEREAVAGAWIFLENSRRIDIAAMLTQSQSMAKPALGRGLGALMGGASPAVKSTQDLSRPAAAIPAGDRIEKVAELPSRESNLVHSSRANRSQKTRFANWPIP